MNEALFTAAVFVATGIGYIIGRLVSANKNMNRPPPEPLVDDDDDDDAPSTVHPYRDFAPPTKDAGAPKRYRLFKYSTHDQKHVYLACPACGARVDDMPVCDCDEVDSSDDRLHFHTKCDNCKLRFAMETRLASAERRAREKREKTEAEKPKAN